MKLIIFKHCVNKLTWPPTQIEFLTWSHNSSQSWSSARALTEINFRRVVCTAVSHTRCNIILQTHHSDMTDMTCFLMTRGRVHFNSRTQLESILGYRVQVVQDVRLMLNEIQRIFLKIWKLVKIWEFFENVYLLIAGQARTILETEMTEMFGRCVHFNSQT